MEGESDKNKGVNGANIDEACISCHQYFDKEDECWGNYVPLTRDEEWILSQMREVKAKVASVNKRLRELESLYGFEPLSPDEAVKSGTEDQVQWLEHKQQLDYCGKSGRNWIANGRKQPTITVIDPIKPIVCLAFMIGIIRDSS